MPLMAPTHALGMKQFATVQGIDVLPACTEISWHAPLSQICSAVQAGEQPLPASAAPPVPDVQAQVDWSHCCCIWAHIWTQLFMSQACVQAHVVVSQVWPWNWHI